MAAIELRVSFHPSGNYTLTEKSPTGGAPKDCTGDLFVNSDAGSFYKAVAQKIADFHRNGIPFVYVDM